jgi:rubrerythrin
MGPVEALKIAMAKEKASIDLYNKLSIEHSSLKELFTFLINEEQKHKKLIEDKIAEATRY